VPPYKIGVETGAETNLDYCIDLEQFCLKQGTSELWQRVAQLFEKLRGAHPPGQHHRSSHTHSRRRFLKNSASLFSGALAAAAIPHQTFGRKEASPSGDPGEATRVAGNPAEA